MSQGLHFNISSFQQHFLVPSCCHFDMFLLQVALLPPSPPPLHTQPRGSLYTPVLDLLASQANSYNKGGSCEFYASLSENGKDWGHTRTLPELSPDWAHTLIFEVYIPMEEESFSVGFSPNSHSSCHFATFKTSAAYCDKTMASHLAKHTGRFWPEIWRGSYKV